MLWIWESCRPRERLPFPGLADSYREAQPAQEHPFHTRTNQREVYKPNHLLMPPTHPVNTAPALNYPGTRCQATRSPREFFRLDNAQWFTLPSCLSHRNLLRAWPRLSPCSCLSPEHPGASPTAPQGMW